MLAILQVVGLYLKGNKRAKEIEKVLPDALQLIAANIRAGMTPDRAIWVSARAEFGALEKEFKRVGAETLGGETLSTAFLNMGERVRSVVLKRTVKLIVEGLESGGQLATLLAETANEIRSLQLMEKEMTASVAMYTMFISFASLVGAPLLYGISTFFMEILTKMTADIGIGDISSQATTMGVRTMSVAATISPAFLFKFALLAVTITTFFAALMIGLIKRGDEKQGFIYAPLFVTVGLLVFWIVRHLVMSMFGDLLIL
jgi:hypothetical protein